MPEDTQDAAHPQLSAAALQEWGLHVEHVLRGIAHALNNRAAALSAVIELGEDPEGDDAAVTRSILKTELARVLDLAKVVRSIGAPKSVVAAFAPSDAAAEALEVLKLHSGLREVTVMIEAHSAPPIRVPRWMFVRALIAVAAEAPAANAAKVTITEEGDWLTTRVEGARRASVSPLVRELARAMGGEPIPDQLGFRLPTLAAVRQREAR